MTSSDYTHSARNSWRLESFVGWISDEIQQTTVKINTESSIENDRTLSGEDQYNWKLFLIVHESLEIPKIFSFNESESSGKESYQIPSRL